MPLYVTFGDKEYRAGIDLSSKDFWRELTARRRRLSEDCRGASRRVSRSLRAPLHRRLRRRHLRWRRRQALRHGGQREGRARWPAADRQSHVYIVDSATASMGVTLLAEMAVELAAQGKSAQEVVAELERRKQDVTFFIVLETLEYLKRGGRISPAQAAIGGVLSVKPIITIEDGVVETADRPRTRTRARARLLELLSAKQAEQVWILHGDAAGVDDFADDLASATGLPRDKMTTHLIGPSVGPHVGPGAYGAVVLLARQFMTSGPSG